MVRGDDSRGVRGETKVIESRDYHVLWKKKRNTGAYVHISRVVEIIDLKKKKRRKRKWSKFFNVLTCVINVYIINVCVKFRSTRNYSLLSYTPTPTSNITTILLLYLPRIPLVVSFCPIFFFTVEELRLYDRMRSIDRN